MMTLVRQCSGQKSGQFSGQFRP